VKHGYVSHVQNEVIVVKAVVDVIATSAVIDQIVVIDMKAVVAEISLANVAP
jgi:hypothetical protein